MMIIAKIMSYEVERSSILTKLPTKEDTAFPRKKETGKTRKIQKKVMVSPDHHDCLLDIVRNVGLHPMTELLEKRSLSEAEGRKKASRDRRLRRQGLLHSHRFSLETTGRHSYQKRSHTYGYFILFLLCLWTRFRLSFFFWPLPDLLFLFSCVFFPLLLHFFLEIQARLRSLVCLFRLKNRAPL